MGITRKRAEERAPFAAALDYTYAFSEDDRLKWQTAVGITTNLSNCGLGFYTHAPVAQGQPLTVFSRQLSAQPLNAEARWCAQVSESIFKVGLKFSRPLSSKETEAAVAEKEAPTVEAREEAPAMEAREELPAMEAREELPSVAEKVAPAAAPEPREDWKEAIASIRARMEVLESKLSDQLEWLLSDNERLRSLSVTDDLTRIYNRRHFFERLAAERNLLDRYGHTLSLMLMDIDNFKYVNDRFGHVEGDSLLREFAEIVKGCLRKGDVFARYGGEEFAAILPHTSGRAALAAAENIRRLVKARVFRAIEGKAKITVSIGVTEIGGEIRDVKEAVKRADRALYEAKIRGKNTVLLWPKGKRIVDESRTNVAKNNT